MIRKIMGWVKNNPVLTSLVVFIIAQTIINAILVMGIIQTQDALRDLMIKLFPPQTWRV